MLEETSGDETDLLQPPWLKQVAFYRLNSPSSVSLFAYERCASPLIFFVALH